MKIDIHTHILPERWPDWTARSGYPGWISLEQVRSAAGGCACARMLQSEPGGKHRFFREVLPNCWDAAVRMGEMDALMGQDSVQILSTVPVMFSYWARSQDAYDLGRLLNDHIAAVSAANPSRFAGLCTLPMQDPALAVKELERCVRDLKFAGVQIGTNIDGLNLDEPSVVEVLRAAEELGACVFVHPWDMLRTATRKVRLGEPGYGGGPGCPEIHPRLVKHWMNWLVGMPMETGLAICSVVFGGVLERLPRLRIGFAHGGGSFPGTIGRIEHGFHARPDLCQTGTKVSPEQHLGVQTGAASSRPARFYVDSLTHEPHALRNLIRLMGAERVMLGSDYPFPLRESKPGEMIEAMHDLPAVVRSQLMSRTALEFLGLGEGQFKRC